MAHACCNCPVDLLCQVVAKSSAAAAAPAQVHYTGFAAAQELSSSQLTFELTADARADKGKGTENGEANGHTDVEEVEEPEEGTHDAELIAQDAQEAAGAPVLPACGFGSLCYWMHCQELLKLRVFKVCERGRPHGAELTAANAHDPVVRLCLCDL